MKDPLKAIQAQRGIKPGTGRTAPQDAPRPTQKKRKGATERPLPADQEPDAGRHTYSIPGKVGCNHGMQLLAALPDGVTVHFVEYGDGRVTIEWRKPC